MYYLTGSDIQLDPTGRASGAGAAQGEALGWWGIGVWASNKAVCSGACEPGVLPARDNGPSTRSSKQRGGLEPVT